MFQLAQSNGHPDVLTQIIEQLATRMGTTHGRALNDGFPNDVPQKQLALEGAGHPRTPARSMSSQSLDSRSASPPGSRMASPPTHDSIGGNADHLETAGAAEEALVQPEDSDKTFRSLLAMSGYRGAQVMRRPAGAGVMQRPAAAGEMKRPAGALNTYPKKRSKGGANRLQGFPVGWNTFAYTDRGDVYHKSPDGETFRSRTIALASLG